MSWTASDADPEPLAQGDLPGLLLHPGALSRRSPVAVSDRRVTASVRSALGAGPESDVVAGRGTCRRELPAHPEPALSGVGQGQDVAPAAGAVAQPAAQGVPGRPGRVVPSDARGRDVPR